MERYNDYSRRFMPDVYLKTYYSEAEQSKVTDKNLLLGFRLNNLYQIVKMLPAKPENASTLLIDVGCGPCIHSIVTLSSYFDRIVCSDYVPANRAAVQSWVNNDENAHSWAPILKFCASLEGIDAKTVENRLRSRIKEVLPCNVHDSVPVSGYAGKADGVLSSLCLENACETIEQLNKALSNIVGLLKTEGHLILIGCLGETHYKIVDAHFQVLKISIDDIKRALVANGMTILHMDIHNRDDMNLEMTDYDSLFILLAKRHHQPA